VAGRPVQGTSDPARCLRRRRRRRAGRARVLVRAGRDCGHIFNLGHGVYPPPILDANGRPQSCTTRERRALDEDRRARDGYGTRRRRTTSETYYTRFDTASTTPSSSPISSAVQRHWRHVAAGSEATMQVTGIAAALERRAPGAFDVRFGSKYEPPLLETTANRFGRRIRRRRGPPPRTHSSSMSTDQYMSRSKEALGERVTSSRSARGGSSGLPQIIADRVKDPSPRSRIHGVKPPK